MNRLALSLVVTALAGAPAYADATAAPATPDTAGFHLKNRSTFTSPETSRPPFWPVGWVKHVAGAPVQVANAPVPEIKVDASQFSVTSILLGTPSLAVINGKSYGQGDYLRMGRATPRIAGAPVAAGVRVQVQKISDGLVTLVVADQAFTVPLRRPQLSDHKVDEDPLLPPNER